MGYLQPTSIAKMGPILVISGLSPTRIVGAVVNEDQKTLRAHQVRFYFIFVVIISRNFGSKQMCPLRIQIPASPMAWSVILVPAPAKINFVSLILTECTYVLVGTFSCIKIDQRKARERELATFDEDRRAVGMLEPMCDKNEGEKGRHM